MKLKLILLFFISYFPFFSFSQSNYEVKGTITDTAATYQMVNSTITILNAKDSTLVKYTRAGTDGAFKLRPQKAGKFILLVSYPGYADYVEDFSLDSLKRTHDFGQVNLLLKSTLLNDVIIKGKINAIKMKGDTTEFNAAAYVIQPNSKVEDLLKQLPGISIDKDGKITAQGQTVKKVLVDGEEFFGDDPTLVTKNLRGDMVDKVQLYDKTSDQAAFTGIDDGEKSKTINIKLKEDKKQGYFGKLGASAATDKYYQEQGMVNVFKGKKKFAAYGTIANTGKTGLSWGDSNKYGSSNMQIDDSGAFSVYIDDANDGLDSFSGQYDGKGIPKTKNGGTHFSNKWNKDKESINANYKIGMVDVTGDNNTLTQQNIPATGNSNARVINSESDESFDKHLFRQKLDGTYTINLDSNATLKIAMDGTTKNNSSATEYKANSLREDGTEVNNSSRSLNNKGDQRDFNASVLYTQKLKKKGRTFSLRLAQNISENNNNGYLYSKNQFFKETGGFEYEKLVDQKKTSHTNSSKFNTNATYTEPLSDKWTVLFNYGLNLSQGSSDKKSFNKDGEGNYNQLDQEFSNSFDLDQISNQGGAVFNYKNGKTILSFGTKVANVDFKQLNEYTKETYKMNFLNWSPQANYRYNLSQQKNFSVYYNGNTVQPSINQLQPVKVNTDPLNINLGSPNLKPSFQNNIEMSYSSYKVITNESIWLSANYGLTTNAISNSSMTNDKGESTYQPVNLNGKTPSNYGLNLYYERKIKFMDLNMGLNGGFYGSTSYSMVNNDFNTTTNNNYNANISLAKRKEKKYDLYFSGGPTYKVSESSLQTTGTNNGWGANANMNFNLYLPGKIEMGTDWNYQYRAKTQTFNQTFERFIWNASISKKFFKAEDLRLSLSANDLLNQNTGFERNANNNFVTEERYNTIKRYFMLSLIWDFNKMGGSTPKK
ncbi:outer membrane beta-barrel family protein [Pedobacter gandavensis]|uniref:outer membrane beta-barrel family protein n=1 Tax=Pedobacter gandavensis TaxID=2679963 RepID=UPI00292F4E5A|nr:outer membrane beta-barrel family protein [Pedobacter gandavensis]